MKRLILTTIVTLGEEQEHFLYKYLQANGHTPEFVSTVQNTGKASKTEEAEGITVVASAEVMELG